MSIYQGTLKFLDVDKRYKGSKLIVLKNQNICKNKELEHMPTWRTVVPGSTMTD